jgi:EpsI family protein
MRSPRYWTVVLLLVVTAFILYHRGDTDDVPPSDPLSLMPQTIDGMTSQDFPLDDETLAILGKGDFLNREYYSPNPSLHPASISSQPPAANTSVSPPIGLFIGYFASQRTGQSIHSPQHCLPGAGWTFEPEQEHYTDLLADNGKKFRVGEYVISNGTERQFVLYWYQAHGRSIANEYVAHAYMIADAIRYNRTDGSLVRVITQIRTGEPVADVRARAVRFTAQMAPMLSRFIPD